MRTHWKYFPVVHPPIPLGKLCKLTPSPWKAKCLSLGWYEYFLEPYNDLLFDIMVQWLQVMNYFVAADVICQLAWSLVNSLQSYGSLWQLLEISYAVQV